MCGDFKHIAGSLSTPHFKGSQFPLSRKYMALMICL